jgi:hypothetical protein
VSVHKLGYLVLCDAHGKVAGKDCIYGVFNRIFVGRFPAVHEMCFLAFELWTTSGDHKLSVRIRNSEGTDVVPQMGPLDMKVSAVGQASGAIQLRNLPLEKPGIYSFVVEIDGEAVGARDLIVEPIPTQRPAQA